MFIVPYAIVAIFGIVITHTVVKSGFILVTCHFSIYSILTIFFVKPYRVFVMNKFLKPKNTSNVISIANISKLDQLELTKKADSDRLFKNTGNRRTSEFYLPRGSL